VGKIDLQSFQKACAIENKKRHIVIICSRLDQPGGIERAIANTANLFAQKGNAVTVLILDETESIFFQLDPEISISHAHLHFGITPNGNVLTRKLAFFRHITLLKKKLNSFSPDVVIATENVFAIATGMVMKNTEAKIFSWEHHHFHHLDKSRFWKALFNKYYPSVDKVVCLNPEEAGLFENMGCKTTVIPNFVSKYSVSPASLDKQQILTIGWLSQTKGTDLIPAIAKKIFARHPQWKWKIIGRGNAISTSKNKLPNIEINEPVSPDIDAEYNSSSIYVLPSRFECFPMVLLEAMSHGLPCIAFDCPTGPKYIIENNEDGMLIPPGNIDAMADAIIELIEEEGKRKRMGLNAFEKSKRFSAEKAYVLWEELFTN
jgi:glycosyltransferase involved in cell wall biosynthesis